MIADTQEITAYIKSKLEEKRYLHSVNTARAAVALAGLYGADTEKAYIAGLLHDVAKGLPEEELNLVAKENGIVIDKYESANPELLHGKVGAAIVKKELGINDEDILSSIRWHTTGRENMSLLEKIIYIADIIEPGRNYAHLDDLKRLAYIDIDEAMKLSLINVMDFVAGKGFTLHPRSVEAYNFFINKEEEKKVEI